MNRYSLHFEVAVLVSLLLHIMTFGCWEYRSELARFSLFKPIAALANALRPPAYTPEKPAEEQTITFMPAPESKPKPEPPPEQAKQFIETDKSQVTGEKPKNARFYSENSTVAANPENPTGKNGETPYLNGKETRIPSTENVVPGTGAGGQPMAPPAPPPPTAAQKAAAEARQRTPPSPAPQAPQPKQLPNKGLAVVEVQKLAMAPPEMESAPRPAPAPAPAPEQPALPAQPAPALAAGIPGSDREIVAAKTHLVAAGVSRNGIAAFNVEGSPFGAYDKQIVRAVQSRWYQLIDQNNLNMDGAGKVTVHFQLLNDGSVQGVKTVENTAGEILALFCEKAIVDSGPFEALPQNLRLLVGSEPRDVDFTFYY
jgi:hypothetical protein